MARIEVRTFLQGARELAMNCDQVFNILTRGPFPSGDATDSAVEIHLTLCADCRHFAEALRPDGSTESEALVPEESRGLPYYWGVAAMPGGDPVGSLTATEGRRTRRRRKPTLFERHEPLAHLTGWQLAFAVLMGALLGMLLRLIGYADIGGPSTPAVASTTPAMSAFDARRPNQDHTYARLTEKLGMTPSCLSSHLPGFAPHDLRERSRMVEGIHENCCTECHNASAARFALRGSTTKLIRSCQVCHNESTSGGARSLDDYSHP